MLCVDDDVQGEARAGARRDRPDVVVHRVAVDDAPACVRIADAPGVVEREHSLERGQAGGDHLRSTREPGEEVRFDEPRRDADVGVDPFSVQPHGDIGAEAAEPYERSVVA